MEPQNNQSMSENDNMQEDTIMSFDNYTQRDLENYANDHRMDKE